MAPLSFVTLDGSLSIDPDPGDSLTYLWEQTLGDPITLSDVSVAMPTFTAPATPQDLIFKLTVTDTSSEFSSNTVKITVSSAPLPAAAWLFGSGLLGLFGMARRRR